MERICNSESKKFAGNVSFQNRPSVSENSNKFVEKRLTNYLNDIFSKYEGEFLDKNQFLKILTEIGFIKENFNSSKNEDKLIENMWFSLSQNASQIPKFSLFDQLLKILDSTLSETNENRLNQGRKYSLFKANRLNSISCERKLQQKTFDECTFSPKISQKSIIFAQSARKRSTNGYEFLNKNEMNSTPIKKNIFNFLDSKSSAKCRTQSELKSREIQEMEKCTFKPHINKVPKSTYDSQNGLEKNLSFIIGSRKGSKERKEKNEFVF